MSKMGKAAEPARLEKLPFKDALQKLEATVEAMDSGYLPSEMLLARYEKGMA